jgi:uncharacterized alpha-E superfamily protein
VRFCIREIREELGDLRNASDAQRVIEKIRRKLRDFEAEKFSQPELHAYIDELQLLINGLHKAIADTWFLSAK